MHFKVAEIRGEMQGGGTTPPPLGNRMYATAIRPTNQILQTCQFRLVTDMNAKLGRNPNNGPKLSHMPKY